MGKLSDVFGTGSALTNEKMEIFRKLIPKNLKLN